MKKTLCAAALSVIALGVIDLPLEGASHKSGALTPVRNTAKRGAYTIETIGDTLNQASPQNTRIIIRVSGSDKKLIKPDSIALIDKSGAAIKPVAREDRKVGHEENTGLPISVGGYGDTSGAHATGVGINLNKVFGPHGDYARSTRCTMPRVARTKVTLQRTQPVKISIRHRKRQWKII